jgi:hypothetical protein
MNEQGGYGKKQAVGRFLSFVVPGLAKSTTES